MNYDEFEEVINGEQTYERIGQVLNNNKSCIIGWTDQLGSHYDILFVVNAMGFGKLQGGVKPDDLFVSIMRQGAFGFETNNVDTAGSYYGEKLRLGGETITCDKLAELINGVKKWLQ